MCFKKWSKNFKIKKKWKKFQEIFISELTDFEKKSVVPTLQTEFNELVKMMEHADFLRSFFSNEEWAGIEEFINKLKEYSKKFRENVPDNLSDLGNYLSKVSEHCDQIEILYKKIYNRIPPTSLTDAQKHRLYTIQALTERTKTNISVWHSERNKLNNLIYSLLLEERKISYANKMLLMQFLAVIIGILFSFNEYNYFFH